MSYNLLNIDDFTKKDINFDLPNNNNGKILCNNIITNIYQTPKLINKSLLDEIITYTSSNRFGLDIELIYFANKNKYKIYEVGIIWKEKKSSSVSIIKDSFIMLFEILKLRFK